MAACSCVWDGRGESGHATPGSSLEYLVLFELVVCCLVLQLFGAHGGVLDLGGVWGVSVETTASVFCGSN